MRLHVPVARLADALPIMADVALRPDVPAGRARSAAPAAAHATCSRRATIRATIAALAFARVLYGTSAPLRHGDDGHRGDDQDVHRRTTCDGFYAAALPSRQRDADRRRRRHGRHGRCRCSRRASARGRRPRGGRARQAAGYRRNGRAREIYLVDKPGAPQSQIRIGSVGVPRSTPDYFPLQVLNTILGGSFSSRLNMNLREKHGYTYGANSSFDMRAEAGPFCGRAGVQTDKTAEALKEFFNELNAIQKPVPAEELARAKNYVALRFPSGFETTGDISRRLEDALVYHLPDDYFAKYVQNIEAVTARRRSARGAEIHPPRPGRRGRRRRSEGDRARHPRAEPGADQDDDDRRRVRSTACRPLTFVLAAARSGRRCSLLPRIWTVVGRPRYNGGSLADA